MDETQKANAKEDATTLDDEKTSECCLAEKVNGADIKDYAETTMNELLGLYGYSKVDSTDTRNLNLDRFKTTASSTATTKLTTPPISPANFETPETSPDQRELEANEKECETAVTDEPHSADSESSMKAISPQSSSTETSLAAQHKLLVSALETKRNSPSPDPGKAIICAWCLRQGQQLFTLSTEKGTKAFCSEVCFTQCRRASFKKSKICDWCKHTRHTVNYVDFQDGDELLQFCSNKCLNQYKMNIFCCETQEHLKKILNNPESVEGKISPGSTSESAKQILITPELWDQQRKHKKRKHKKSHKKHLREKIKSHLPLGEGNYVEESCSSLQLLSNLVGREHSVLDKAIITSCSRDLSPPGSRDTVQSSSHEDPVKADTNSWPDKARSSFSPDGLYPPSKENCFFIGPDKPPSTMPNPLATQKSPDNRSNMSKYTSHILRPNPHSAKDAISYAKSSETWTKTARPINSQLFNTTPLAQSPDYSMRDPPTLHTPSASVSPFPRMPSLVPLSHRGLDPVMFGPFVPPYMHRMPPPPAPNFLDNVPLGIPPVTMMLPFPFILPVPIPIPIPFPMDKEKIDEILKKGKSDDVKSHNANDIAETERKCAEADDTLGVLSTVKSEPDVATTTTLTNEVPHQTSSYSSPTGATPVLHENRSRCIPKWVQPPEEGAPQTSLKRSSHSRRCSSVTCAELVIDNLCYKTTKSHDGRPHKRSSSPPPFRRIANAASSRPNSPPRAMDLSKTRRVDISPDDDSRLSQSDVVDSSDRSSEKELDLSVPQIHIVSASEEPPLSQNMPVLADGTKYSKRRGLILDAPCVPKRPRSPTPERAVYIRTQKGNILEARRRYGRARIRTK